MSFIRTPPSEDGFYFVQIKGWTNKTVLHVNGDRALIIGDRLPIQLHHDALRYWSEDGVTPTKIEEPVGIERDPYLKVWALSERGALQFFGFEYEATEYEVVVLQEQPLTEREKAQHRPSAKLFGVRRKV